MEWAFLHYVSFGQIADLSRQHCGAATSAKNDRLRLLVCAFDWAHDEDCVARRIEEVEGSRAPDFIFWLTQDLSFCAPLTVVAIGILDPKRYARVSAMAVHRAIEGHFNASTLQPD
jgi:hypothetical protein